MVERFEDLIAWKKARELNRLVYACTRVPPFSKDFRLCSQIQSASVSIMANIAEGFERGRQAEFHQYLSIAKGSCGEVRSHLFAALDIGYISDIEFEGLVDRTYELTRIINGLRSKLQGWQSPPTTEH
jgi:four helix bundle protein